ncbi:LicD family-domain-containing protein [Scheffersomyces xylosifermentans]|uniref:LicD family-domain-containing protein n=1 Tax=Scheffersomyces xylosifermentans TaxID=1304137 RepID=UPI00315C8A13
MLSDRILKTIFVVLLVLNIGYFLRVYSWQELRLNRAAMEHVSSINYDTDDQVEFPDDVPYESITDTKQKISYLLNKVEANEGDRYWLANTSVKHPSLRINPGDFLPSDTPNWQNSAELFFDPRFTLSVYLDELKHQLMDRNPKNEKSRDHLISMPFSWADWVDLTMLNEELAKPIEDRAKCEWLQSHVNKPTKYPDFCSDLVDATDEEIAEIGLPREHLPGFLVKGSPMNKAPHKQVMMQGKAHLLAFQENPLSIVFLTASGTYEVQIHDERKRIVHTEMFENYLNRRGINANHLEDINNEITLNPQEDFTSLLSTIAPRPLNLDDDIYKMNAITRQTDANASRELYLDTKAFDYKHEKVIEQLHDYQYRIDKLEDSFSNELHYNPDVFREYSLDRHEFNHYGGIKCAESYSINDEPTYYKLATLLKDKTNKDAGWHYEWRFFNGALRYIKDETWTMSQLEVREQIILDRLLRNWFRFAEEKGLISWIAHGPLLSWYWDGLMFPFDIDIDIQMPSAELNRLSKHYNMTLVVEDVQEGFGKFLIDCSTFLHHRDMAAKDNHIDARFIDVDTGTYIDITGIGKNNENPPPEYDSYIRNKNAHLESVELYMDRRKHWLSFEKINPLRYSSIGGVPVYVPNDIMSMLNHEYSQGTAIYHFQGYYYVPCLRLWVLEDRIKKIFNEDKYMVGNEIDKDKLLQLIVDMRPEQKLTLLESDDELLIEYYLTQKQTALHEVEKKFMLDPSLKFSTLDLHSNYDYHQLTSKFKMSKPFRKSLFDWEYFERFDHEVREDSSDRTAESQKLEKPKINPQSLAAGVLTPKIISEKPNGFQFPEDEGKEEELPPVEPHEQPAEPKKAGVQAKAGSEEEDV